MNQIKIQNCKIEFEVDDSFEIEMEEQTDLTPLKVVIHVKKETTLHLDDQSMIPSKMDFKIMVDPFVTLTLFENIKETNRKIQYQYELMEKATVDVYKFQDTSFQKELDIIYLNGLDAKINISLKGISTHLQKYHMVIYHNAPNTKSNIQNQLVALQEGKIDLSITSIVYPKIKNAYVNQNNRILNLNEKEHSICPNLLIEENEVEASHSAHIGPFEEELIFYMMSRGIPSKEAIFLLLKGFLKQDFMEEEELTNILKQYWR